ncbi:hypothetical protein AB1L07_02595 [Niallia alba]|uniref:hypothetical protein n=1 Tax=Niallia alba TaxID=2729105 RepID=UPI0039A0B31C
MDNPCIVCQEEVFLNTQENKWMMRIQNSNWNDYIDDFDYEDIEINFCYQCGKDYRNHEKI